METLHEKLKKIEALATSGVDGERENAGRMLELLCRKYGLKPEQFANPEKKFYRFKCANEKEKELLCQIVINVLQSQKVRNRPKGRSPEYELTIAQHIDVVDAFRHYRAAWKKDVEDLFQAFICRHHIYGPPSDSPDDETESDAETKARAKRIFGMMQNLGSETLRRQVVGSFERLLE